MNKFDKLLDEPNWKDRAAELQAQINDMERMDYPCKKCEKLEAQVDRVKAIPEKAKERGASHYQQGWIAGWNGFYDELQSAINGDGDG